jgi:hypothetical protein
MIKITKAEYYKKHKDQRGVWSSDNIQGTKHNGKRTMLHYDNGTCLLIEGIGFEIIPNPKTK